MQSSIKEFSLFLIQMSLKSLVVLVYFKSSSLNLASARWQNRGFPTCIPLSNNNLAAICKVTSWELSWTLGALVGTYSPMSLEAEVQTSIQAMDPKIALRLGYSPSQPLPGYNRCPSKDISSDPAGALQRTWWQSYLSMNLGKGPLSADLTVGSEVDLCLSTTLPNKVSSFHEPVLSSTFHSNQMGFLPIPPVIGLPTTDTMLGPTIAS